MSYPIPHGPPNVEYCRHDYPTIVYVPKLPFVNLFHRLRYLKFKHQLTYLGKNTVFQPSVAIYNPKTVSIGNYCLIDRNVIIEGNLKVGNNTHLCANTLYAGRGGITIGNYTGIAFGTAVHAGVDLPDMKLVGPLAPEWARSVSREPVSIGSNVQIGSNCIILSGATIPNDCIIGSLSLVRGKDVLEEGYIYAGIPVKKIRRRYE